LSQSRFVHLREAFLKRPLMFAAFSAVAAALLASGYLSRREAELIRVSEPVSVVVANREIASGETLNRTSLAVKEIPRRFVEVDALTDIESASGRLALVPIRSGSRITASSARLPSSVGGLAGQVPMGRRAYSIGLERSRAAGGLIRPNDSVDVIAAFDIGGEGRAKRTTFTVVEGAQVLAVGNRMAKTPIENEGEKRRGSMFGAVRRPLSDELTVTLAVAPADAQKLALAESAGSVSLALRPFAEPEDANSPMPTTISSIASGNEELFPIKHKFREYRGRR
jgi:pilus assembly protein CpaB